MPGCAAVNCTNSTKKGFLMKRFPRDPKRRKEWRLRTKRANWTPTNFSYLCEVHFSAEMWEKTREDGKRKLKPYAIPTIFSSSKPQKSRKPPRQRESLSKEKDVLITGKSTPSPSTIETNVKMDIDSKQSSSNSTPSSDHCSTAPPAQTSFVWYQIIPNKKKGEFV